MNHLFDYEYKYGTKRLGCVVNTAGELSISGTDGKEMLRGLLKITRIDHDYQPDPGARPIAMATLQFTPAEPPRKPYNVQVPYSHLLNEFDAVLAKITPEGTYWDNTRDQLLSAVLCLSDEEQSHRVPVSTTAVWLQNEGDHAGLYDHGYRVAEPLEIVSETENTTTGETEYRLRTPKKDSPGDYEYTVVNWNQLNEGAFYFGGRSLHVWHAIRCSMALRERFAAADKNRFIEDEAKQLDREHKKKIEGMFLINGRLPNGRLPK